MKASSGAATGVAAHGRLDSSQWLMYKEAFN